jgi:hypothetical protein
VRHATHSPRAIAGLLAAGAAGSFALFGLWPWLAPASDPLRGLVVLLPLTASWLAAIHWHLGRSTRRIRPLIPAALAWTLLALARHAFLGAGSDAVFACGYFALLAVAVWRTALILRPLLAATLLPAKPSALFFLLPLVVYTAILPWSLERPPDGDEPYYLLLTHSLAHDFDTDLTNNYRAGDARHFIDRPLEPQMGDPRGPNGEILSRHNALLPLLLVPLYWVGGRLGAAFGMAAMTAALAWVFLRLAHHWVPGRPRAVFQVWLLFTFGPPLLFYSHQIWIEVPAALLWAVAWERLLALDAGEGRRDARGLLAFGLPLAVLPLLKIRLLLAALPLVVLALYRLRVGRGRRWLPVAFFGLTVGALMLYNAFFFGNPFKMYSWGDIALIFADPGAHLRGLAGIFYDCAFGLFAAAPLWALLPTAALALFREARPLALQGLWLVLPYTLGFAPRLEWYGGWAPAFRYPLVFLPLLAVVLTFALDRRRPWLRPAWAALGTATVALTLLWLTVPGLTYNLADGSNHLLTQAGDRLALDLGRFFPSMVRLRPATFAVVALALLLAPLLLLRRPRGLRWRRLGAPAGLLALGLAAAVLPWLGHAAPTATVEIEDAWVAKHGGTLYPERWTLSRPSFRGGWMLQPGDTARAPVVAGGRQVIIELAAHNPNQRLEMLELRAGDQVLAEWPVPAGYVFHQSTFGPFDWPPGAPLILRASGQGALIVDRADLSWR